MMKYTYTLYLPEVSYAMKSLFNRRAANLGILMIIPLLLVGIIAHFYTISFIITLVGLFIYMSYIFILVEILFVPILYTATLNGPIEMELTESNIKATYDFGSLSVEWSDIIKVQDERRFYFLFVSKKMFYIVPKKGLRRHDDFFQLFKQKMKL